MCIFKNKYYSVASVKVLQTKIVTVYDFWLERIGCEYFRARETTPYPGSLFFLRETLSTRLHERSVAGCVLVSSSNYQFLVVNLSASNPDSHLNPS